MKSNTIKLFMDIAERVAQESKAERLKVGCIIVKDGQRIISIGYNGTPSGWDNCCEYEEYHERDSSRGSILKTKPCVIHAEANAIGKLAGCSESAKGADVFTTHAPCLECAKTLAVSKIKTVFYKYSYRNSDGLDHLKKCNIKVIKLEEEKEEI